MGGVRTGRISSYEDLDVYKRLFELHLEVNSLTLRFPSYEMYELGSQLRRSSNAIAANLAEAWNDKHLNVYLQGINRALGELRETRHHLAVAHQKKHCTTDAYKQLDGRYDECGKMLRALERALEKAGSSHHRSR